MAPHRSAPFAASVLLLAMILCIGTVTGLGINCRGSGFCPTSSPATVQLRDAVNNDGDPNRLYNNGQQIACTDNNVCAFVQNFGGQVSEGRVGTLLGNLVDHGCKTCGSVPLDFPNFQ
ncbi:hypothetical protein M758_2G226500 [Ceratodon purpureus]|nr:hypothetical protein M758_2G226500 [Ceratodon purpureus]